MALTGTEQLAIEQEKTRRMELQAQQKSSAQAQAEQRRQEQARQKAAQQEASRRAKAEAAEAARVRSARAITVPISPSAAQVQIRRESPFAGLEGGGFWSSVGAYLAGTGMDAILVTILPAENKWLGALIGGLVGGVVTMTSPTGTWVSEAGQGALSSALGYGIIATLATMRRTS